jgi:pyruvate dehydrogenase E1 component alpha subunit
MAEINHENILRDGKYKGLSIKETAKETAILLYRFMLRLRRLQEEIIKEYHPANEMRCPVHFCIGQEAVPAALSQLLQKDDFLFGPHRSHGYYLAKGGPIKDLLAELYGRQTGTNGGKAGSQEISMTTINFYAGAILSGLLGIAVGVALSFQLKKKSNISVVCLGDGAVDEGIFWEAISYAQLCKLPVVFICENNRYSTYSPQLKRQPADDIHKRVAAFGLKSEALFGNDVVAVKSVLDEAFQYTRKGKGPVFIEAYTYRWHGHVGPEDDDYVGYRSASELEFWKKNCPILLLEKQLLDKHILTSKLKNEMLNEVNKEIIDAFKFAKNSPFPDDTDWETQNYCPNSPLADKLLIDQTQIGQFKHDQAETMPEPY